MSFSERNTKASKLNGVQVLEIRAKYNSGLFTQARLAREYQISISTIYNIVNGLTWQSLPNDTQVWVEQQAPGARVITDEEIEASMQRLMQMQEQAKVPKEPDPFVNPHALEKFGLKKSEG